MPVFSSPAMVSAENLTKDFYPALSLRHLLKDIRRRTFPTRALDGISFSLPRGKVLAVLGPNGAGKTTLLKALSTLILPDSGTVSIDGCRLGIDDEKIKSSLGLVMDEERSFYWRLTGRQNLEFFTALYGMSPRDSRRRIEELLKLFKVDYADKRFDAYSTGMKKNFALMRGLLHDPALLLCDEPTKSLDYRSGCALQEFIKKNLVNRLGKTVIFTTHQIDSAFDFANLFLILDKGRMRAFGSLDDLRKKTCDPAASLSGIYLTLTTENHCA